MKTRFTFTCPKCQGHILDHTLQHTESTTEQLVGMDKEGEGIYAPTDAQYSERENINSYSCGQCKHQVAGDVEVGVMIEKGTEQGWLKTEEDE